MIKFITTWIAFYYVAKIGYFEQSYEKKEKDKILNVKINHSILNL